MKWLELLDIFVIFQEKSGSSVPSIINRVATSEQPPTYNKTNNFTGVFQSIIDAYGVPKYREVNPGQQHNLLLVYYTYFIM